MVYRIYSGWSSFTLKITVKTLKDEKIVLKVQDEDMANTVFTNRFMIIKGKQALYVRMPVSGNISVVNIYNEANGNNTADSSFKVVNIEIIPLVRKMDVVDIRDAGLNSFIRFITRFCFNAGSMMPGTYKSADNQFVIVYSPTIIDSESGKPLNTPARINKNTGLIEIAQDKFISMTVPMRMAIALHEYSHYYINYDINNETEADLNALLIYLGLGYPRIEACEAFLDTFIKSSNGPNPLTGSQKSANSERYNAIKRFIEDFEKTYMVMEN